MIALWLALLLGAAWVTHWGAGQIVKPLKKVRRQWGLTSVAGAAILAIVTASPEVATNTVSAVRGVADIGLGNMLGSNIISIPLIVTVAYLASRRSLKASGQRSGDATSKSKTEHSRHQDEHFLALEKRSVTELAIPYLIILVLVAVLTLPEPWRGLQPIDGWIMLSAYAVFLMQAVLRGRSQGKHEQWAWSEIGLAIAGAGAIGGGAYLVIFATEQIVSDLGISQVVGGLFITGTLSTLPEVVKTWNVVRSGQTTAGTSSVIADNAVTMTLGFLPLALVTTSIEDLRLYWVNLLFVALMPAAYAVFIHWSGPTHGFRRWQVIAFDALYLAYLAVVLLLVLEVFG
jgi:cation:H+ antiporter